VTQRRRLSGAPDQLPAGGAESNDGPGERALRTFAPDPSEVFSARHFVSSALEKWGIECDDLALLVSELATNAVLHARSDFEVAIIRLGRRVRVEVFDQNTRLPSFVVAPPDAYSGRGLMLLRQLAIAWGVEPHSDVGKTIWFELDLPPTAGPETPASCRVRD
jgi:anti-sigma regulatory factor (Ser/Thr protein kinase)